MPLHARTTHQISTKYVLRETSGDCHPTRNNRHPDNTGEVAGDKRPSAAKQIRRKQNDKRFRQVSGGSILTRYGARVTFRREKTKSKIPPSEIPQEPDWGLRPATPPRQSLMKYCDHLPHEARYIASSSVRAAQGQHFHTHSAGSFSMPAPKRIFLGHFVQAVRHLLRGGRFCCGWPRHSLRDKLRDRGLKLGSDVDVRVCVWPQPACWER